MSSFDLVELVMTKTLQATDKETVREFWKDIGMAVFKKKKNSFSFCKTLY